MSVRLLLTAWLAITLAAGPVVAAGSSYLVRAEGLLAKGQVRAAEIELKNAIRADPKDMPAHYRLAVVQLELGEAAAAEHEASVARAGGYDPDKTTPLLARTYLAQGKYAQLLKDFSGSEGDTTERAGVLVARGYAQLALGRRDDAKNSFSEAQTVAPNAPGPLLAEAKLLMSERQFAAAETIFDRVLTHDPKSAEARLGKANLLRINGHPRQALAILGHLITDHPGDVAARLERGEILVSQGKGKAASGDLNAVLGIQPGNPVAIYMEAVIAAGNRDFEKANANLSRISGVLAAIPRGYYVQAFVDFNLRRLDQAEDAARRYVARNPDDLAGQKLLGAIELGLGRPADTVAALSKFESDGKADAGALDLLGRAYTELGKMPDALRAFSSAVKLAPQNAALRMRLGIDRLRTGETQKGAADLERSLNIAPSAPAGEALVLTEIAAGRWGDAVGTATKLAKAQPNSPVPGNLIGLINLAQFDLAGARAEFSGLAAKYPAFLPAQLNLARVAELQGKVGEAEHILKAVLDKEPANGVVLTRLVQLLMRNGGSAQALAAAEHAHAEAPTNKGITAGLINLYLQLGHKEKALTLAQQESESNEPDNVPLIAARVRAELAVGRKSNAAQDLRRLIGITPSATAFRRELAAVLLSAGDAAGARQTIDAARKIAPQDPHLAADRLAIDVKTEGLAAALNTAARLQKSEPGLPTATALRGDTYMLVHNFPKAAEAYEIAFRQSPSALLAVRLARANSAAGHADAAATVLRGWLKNHPDDAGVGQMLADYDIGAHRYAEAEKELEKVIAKAPQDAIALNNLAWLHQHAGDPQARSLAERAYLLAPSLPQTADTLGWILVQQGQSAKAVVLLERASAGKSSSPAIRYHLAVALNNVGRRQESLKVLASLVSGPAKFDDRPAAQKLFAQLKNEKGSSR